MFMGKMLTHFSCEFSCGITHSY